MATKKVTLDPGQSQEVAFTFTPDIAKVYAVSVNGLSGIFQAIVVGEGYFTVSPEWRESNVNLAGCSCKFTVTNTGNAPKTEKVQWWVRKDYEVIAGGGRTITLAPGDSQNFTINVDHPGTPGQGYVTDISILFRTEEMDGHWIIHFY